MNKKYKPSAKAIHSLCAEVHDDDGLDPFELAKLDQPIYNKNRKDFQVCKHAHRIINSMLLGESANPILAKLTVLSVLPQPNSSHLLVTVERQESNLSVKIKDKEIIASLEKDSGRFRSALASSLNRKRAPQLSFIVGIL